MLRCPGFLFVVIVVFYSRRCVFHFPFEQDLNSPLRTSVGVVENASIASLEPNLKTRAHRKGIRLNEESCNDDKVYILGFGGENSISRRN